MNSATATPELETRFRTRFVLLEPSHAGNVGAVARAMKVMGFDELVLVRPRWANVLRRQEAIERASGAVNVLAQAQVVDTMEAALQGMTHLCATAMTARDFGPPTRSPREHFAALAGTITPAIEATPETTSATQGVALLFGSERFGMRNEDVYRCHVCLRIPAHPQFGSLNLAAAVQLVAYEWRQALGGFAPSASSTAPELADAAQVAAMLAHLEQALVAVGYLDPAAPKKLMPRLNALFNRAQISAQEIHILRGVAKAMLETAAQAKR